MSGKMAEWEKWESLSFALDCLLAEMENQHVTYREWARRMGTHGGNLHRDLHRRGVRTWSVAKLLRLFESMGYKLECKMVKLATPEDEK